MKAKEPFEYLKKLLLSSRRRTKQLIVAISDFISVCFATYIAILFSFIDFEQITLIKILSLLWFPLVTVLVFTFSGVYRSVLRFMDFSTLFLILRSLTFVFVISLSIKFLTSKFSVLDKYTFLREESLISTEGWIIGFLTSIILVLGSRIFANYFFNFSSPGKRVVIYGAGSAGIQLASALRVSKEMHPIAFVDKNPNIQGTYLGGLKILNPNKLKKMALRGTVDEVLIAMPSASKTILRNLLKEIETLALKVRVLPGLAELAQGKVNVSELKEVDIPDLLGRFEVEAHQELINKNISNKVVLITGAGGSIGSEISRQVAQNEPKKVILFDSNEYALYSIKNDVESLGLELDIYAVLGSVTNKKRILEVLKTFKVDTIYHAAAYKHVPLVEENPFEAVLNNISGTKICVDSAIESNVETFVLISTDKAVRPTNIMGATKRFSELILQSLAPNTETRMIMVRFGNVIGSSGSAIPLFQQQIKTGGPVTVTHPDVTRYFMSIPEAAELVIQAGAMGKGGDVFVLDMGEPVKIYELAKRLINLSGMEIKDTTNPEGDIEIIFTGLRSGEKLYEELLIGGKVSATKHKQILRAEEDFLPAAELEVYFNSIKEAEESGDIEILRHIFKEVISGYNPEEEIVDILYQQKIN